MPIIRDTINKIKSKSGLVGKIKGVFLDRVSDKKDLELRTRRVCDSYVLILGEMRHRWNQALGKAIKSRKKDDAKHMQQCLKLFDRITDKINHGMAGYSVFCNVHGIDEKSLASALENDLRIAEDIDALRSEMTQAIVKINAGKFAGVKSQCKKFSKQLEGIEKKFSERKKYFK